MRISDRMDALLEALETVDDLDEAKKKGKKKPKLGSGERFKQLVAKLKKRGDIEDPEALAAWIGREKYGKAKFQKMAAKGRKESVLARHLEDLIAEAGLDVTVDDVLREFEELPMGRVQSFLERLAARYGASVEESDDLDESDVAALLSAIAEHAGVEDEFDLGEAMEELDSLPEDERDAKLARFVEYALENDLIGD